MEDSESDTEMELHERIATSDNFEAWLEERKEPEDLVENKIELEINFLELLTLHRSIVTHMDECSNGGAIEEFLITTRVNKKLMDSESDIAFRLNEELKEARKGFPSSDGGIDFGQSGFGFFIE